MAGKKRLLWQLYPSYFLITVVSVLAVTWLSTAALKRFSIGQAASHLRVQSQTILPPILENLDPLDAKRIDGLCKGAGKFPSTRITVIIPSGVVIGDSESNPAGMENLREHPEFTQALAGSFGIYTRFNPILGKRMLYAGAPVFKDDRILAVIRTSVPLDALDEAVWKFVQKAVLAGVIIALFAALVCWAVSRRITRPIEKIRSWTENMARGRSLLRPSVQDSQEIGALSEAIYQAGAELQNRIDTLMRRRNEIEAVLSSMVEGVIAVDTEERVISINHAAAKMFDFDPAEAQGRSIQEVARNSVLQSFVSTALSSQEPVETEIVLASGGEHFVKAHATVLRGSEGKQIGALIVLNDVTDLKRLENIRRDFVANVSHEIKTPLTAIKGFVETLRDGAINEPQDADRFLGIIESHSDRLEAIIEDLLSLSRIEQETEWEKISLVEGSVKNVIQNAMEVCGPRAEAKHIDIKLTCRENLSAKMHPPLLEQAVVNLLDNAIKYSGNDSTVWIEAGELNGRVSIHVRDQGCGIEKKHLSRLFERFYRVDKARSRRLGGTGLGLAIVKHIMQAHGGKIGVESTPGKGSTFSISLPRERSRSVSKAA